MIYIASLLTLSNNSGHGLIKCFTNQNLQLTPLPNTSDIWLRDFMPVQTRSGKWISFRYEPSYLADAPELRTDFRTQIAPQLDLSVTYSDLNLDGGNVVFSPSGKNVIISDRVFSENSKHTPAALVWELETLLEARVITIPSLKSDFTGHADGMVRFVNEHTVIGNRTYTKNGLEQRIRRTLNRHGIDVVDFPYYAGKGISAEGCYLNFLETERCVFLPVFGNPMDAEAVAETETLFQKAVVPVECSVIARQGGGLHCVSWEM